MCQVQVRYGRCCDESVYEQCVRKSKVISVPGDLYTLLFFLVFTTVLTAFFGGSQPFTLSLDTASSCTTEGTCESKVDVLLRVKTNDERGNVDNLLTNADVTLADQNTSVVNRLSKARLVHLGLQTALQEVFHFESQDVIESGRQNQ